MQRADEELGLSVFTLFSAFLQLRLQKGPCCWAQIMLPARKGIMMGAMGDLYLLKNETKKINTQGEWCQKVGFSLVVLRSSQSRQCLDGMSVKSALLRVTSQALNLQTHKAPSHISSTLGGGCLPCYLGYQPMPDTQEVSSKY